VDFIPLDPYSAPALSEHLAELAAEEAIAQSGPRLARPFPGPLFLAVAPVEIEWRSGRYWPTVPARTKP